MKNTLIFRGEHYELVPTFEMLCNIEKLLDQSITHIAVRLSKGELRLQEIQIILEKCLEPKPSENTWQTALLENGFSQITQALARMFAGLFDDVNAVAANDELQRMAMQFPD